MMLVAVVGSLLRYDSNHIFFSSLLLHYIPFYDSRRLVIFFDLLVKCC